MATNKHQKGPLCQEHLDKLNQYMVDHKLSRKGLGRLIGYKESTFRGIMKGRNILRRNREKIAEFVNCIIDSNLSPTDIPKPGKFSKKIKVAYPGLKMDQMRLQALLNQFKSGSDSVISVVKELVNSPENEAARNAIRRVFPQEITDLYIAVRAISSEPALETARADTKKIKNNIFTEEHSH